MLSCKDFMARHSDYRDGLLSPSELDRLRLHLEACASCARYDRVIRKGVSLLVVESTRLRPNADFMDSLHSRLAAEADQPSLRPVTLGASASVSIAALLALAAWIPAMLSHADGDDGFTPQEASVISTEIAWHPRTAIAEAPLNTGLSSPDVSLGSTNADISVIDRGYSPLIIEAPTAPPSYMRASFTVLENR